jgi:hypothetical protein
MEIRSSSDRLQKRISIDQIAGAGEFSVFSFLTSIPVEVEERNLGFGD